ncbi:MAG: hypothetical protein UMR38_08280 [Candidatus Izemoplasma sp.]|nr:hypothetical protein [Candidatus Izemoplasma sp.]
MKKNYVVYPMLIASIGYLFYYYLLSGYNSGFMMMHHMGYYDNFSSTSYFINIGLLILAYIGLIAAILILVSKQTSQSNNALEILNERLTKGEISLEEYREIKRTINQ